MKMIHRILFKNKTCNAEIGLVVKFSLFGGAEDGSGVSLITSAPVRH